jgi:hypothetical protein
MTEERPVILLKGIAEGGGFRGTRRSAKRLRDDPNEECCRFVVFPVDWTDVDSGFSE